MNLRDILYPEGAVCVACGALHARDAQWSLCETCEAALSLLQGPRCPGCGGPGEGLCRRCRARGPGSLDAVTAAFAYTGTARLLVRALKYDGVHTAARALAAGMFRVRPKTPFDAIVPVPLHRWRERSRGFNQAETLSRLLGEAMGLPVLPLLTRARRTGTQTRLTASERADNVEGAFAASAEALGLRLLLVDDVLTTGATAEACACALKAAGALRVELLAAAKAGIGADT